MGGGLCSASPCSATRVLARWASALLAVATVATAALAVLPEAFNRPFAVPTGIALIGLGVSLWREQRHDRRDGHLDPGARRAARSPMTIQQVRPPVQSRGWPVPAILVTLSAIPLAAGTLRLVQLAGGPDLIPADVRYADFPAPLVAHIVGAAVYAVVGAFQFVPAIRRRHPSWHRRAGRVLVVAGLTVAVSALAMTLSYAAKPGTGDLLYVLRLVFGSAMAACLVLGFAAIRRRDIASHRAWMVRAYALGLAAGTQVFTEGIGGAIFGTGELAGDLAKGSAWIINLTIAEWAIRRPTTARASS